MKTITVRPRVSVVINNWNRKADLRDALSSVLCQTYKNIEIIVVDNHSIDGSIEMVRTEFPEIKLVVMPNSNYGGIETCNIGLASATGEYVLMMDNDALLEVNWIEKAIGELENDEKLGLLASKVLNYFTNKDWGFEVYGLDDIWKDKEFYTTVFVGCSAMMRKDVVDKLGYFPNEYYLYHNEFALGAKLINAGYKIKYQPKIIGYHKVTQTQRPGKKAFYYGVRNWYWYIWEYYPINLAIKATPAYFIRTSLASIRSPYIFLITYIDTIRGMPRVLKRRKPIKDMKLLKQPKWQTSVIKAAKAYLTRIVSYK